jgi:hypothetical protein
MKRDLVEGLRQAGFPIVLEYPIFEPYRELTHRVTIVAVKDEQVTPLICPTAT